MTKHTKEQCFKVVGYPDWWVGNKKGKSGKAAATVGSQETTNNGSGSNTHQKGTGNENKGTCFMTAVKGDEEEEEIVTGIGFEKHLSNASSQNSTLFFGIPDLNPRYFNNEILELLSQDEENLLVFLRKN